jgi:uncharacterized protein (DUF697 family)
MTERRQESMIMNVILPVVVAIITGVGASYTATTITLSVVETKVSYLEVDLLDIKYVLLEVKENQIQLAKNSEWMKNMESRVERLENESK